MTLKVGSGMQIGISYMEWKYMLHYLWWLFLLWFIDNLVETWNWVIDQGLMISIHVVSLNECTVTHWISD